MRKRPSTEKTTPVVSIPAELVSMSAEEEKVTRTHGGLTSSLLVWCFNIAHIYGIFVSIVLMKVIIKERKQLRIMQISNHHLKAIADSGNISAEAETKLEDYSYEDTESEILSRLFGVNRTLLYFVFAFLGQVYAIAQQSSGRGIKVSMAVYAVGILRALTGALYHGSLHFYAVFMTIDYLYLQEIALEEEESRLLERLRRRPRDEDSSKQSKWWGGKARSIGAALFVLYIFSRRF